MNWRTLSDQNPQKTLEKDVCTGLLHVPRSLPPKYFYDEKGSKLFEAICKTEDYYPTRTEYSLLKEHAAEILEIVRPSACIELGAGTAAKTELLISKLCEHHTDPVYVTIDVCEEVLVESAYRFLENYSTLKIQSLVGEYIPAIKALPQVDEPKLFIFIGSSIGNFTNVQAIELLGEVAKKMQAKDYLLLGLDRVKDKVTLEKAYDDTDGITAKFNLNVLNVLNTKLNANFDVDKFFHRALYNEQQQQIEMYLVSDQSQEILFPTLGETINLQENERILTEISRKYTRSSIKQLLTASDLIEKAHFQPENEFFSLVLARRA